MLPIYAGQIGFAVSHGSRVPERCLKREKVKPM
jgi:hypothetical protein